MSVGLLVDQPTVGAPAAQGIWRSTLQGLLRNYNAVAGGLFLLVIALACIAAPLLTSHDPAALSPADALKAPSLKFPMGTDHFGRDQLTRILYGGRISLRVGLISVSIGAGFGILLGAIAGYWGGWVDEVISRLIDVKLAFPGILLAMAVVSVLGPSLYNLMIAVGIGWISGFSRLTRSQMLVAKAQDYVVAARAMGCSNTRIVVRHIFPNIMAPIIVYGTLAIAGAILASASLNYLGMGAKPPIPEWGLMLAESRDYIRRAWWLATFPGVSIMATVISINLVGDGLRDSLDPWLKAR